MFFAQAPAWERVGERGWLHSSRLLHSFPLSHQRARGN